MRSTSAILIAALLFAVFAGNAAADGLTLTVNPMVFEFNVPYGGEQQETFTVSNLGSEMERISSRGVDWRTDTGGSVIVERQGSERARSLTPYLRITPANFVLRPFETRTVSISVRMPSGRSVRTEALWGGFLLLAASESGQSTVTPGATVFVYDNTKPSDPHLKLQSLQIHHSGVSRTLVARILNDSSTYARPTVHLIVKRNGTVVRDQVVPVNVIFPGDMRVLSVPLLERRGKYEVHLVLDYGIEAIDGTAHVQIP